MLVLRLLDRRWSRAYGLWHLWLMAPIVALRMRCDSRWQSIVSSECRRRPTPSVAIRHDAILLRVDGGLVLAYLVQPSLQLTHRHQEVEFRTYIGWQVKWRVTILVLTWHDMTNE